MLESTRLAARQPGNWRRVFVLLVSLCLAVIMLHGTRAVFSLTAVSSHPASHTQTKIPTAATITPNGPITLPWDVLQPGYVIEVAATGFQLPIHIAFVPNPGTDPGDPLYYVTELHGKIKVVTVDSTVHEYAADLLNFDPLGNFPGAGEQGVTGVAVHPTTGDVYATMLYSADPSDENAPHYPKIVHFESLDGGISASTQVTIMAMVNITMGQSHQISNISFGPDEKLYVHVGDGNWTGLYAAQAQNINSFFGKILRLNGDGTAPTDNPYYTGSGLANDYIYAYGFRNPFGGDWRDLDGQLYEIENGPSVDRIVRAISATNNGWGNCICDLDMYTNAIYNWSPSHAPVDIAFIQGGTFGGSGFPSWAMGHVYASESGPTWATGPQTSGKRIVEFVLDDDGNLLSGPITLVEYNGIGKASAAGMAAGPDGLYFSDLYKDLENGSPPPSPLDPGANILRIRYVGLTAASGLLGQYYEYSGTIPTVSTFQDSKLERIDPTIDFNWGAGSPAPSVSDNNFSVRWLGQVEPLYTETYTFYANSNNGIRVWIDNQLVIEDWETHNTREVSGTIALQAGQRYDLEVHHYEEGGNAVAQLSWESASQSKEIVPETALFPPADLGLTVSATPDPVNDGELLTYTVEVRNFGPFTATAVTLSNTLPPELSFVSGTGCVEAAGVVTCTLGDMGSEVVATAVFVTQVSTPISGTITNTVSATTTSFDHVPTNNSDTAISNVIILNLPRLYLPFISR
jgi:uncharacterized repeat protein (TIGR01451 family)